MEINSSRSPSMCGFTYKSRHCTALEFNFDFVHISLYHPLQHKMSFLILLAVFVGVALAQSAQIGLPSAGQRLVKGSDVVVQIQRPNTLTGSTEMAVAIGISSCATQACIPSDEYMGTILYNGPFKPEYYESTVPPYQNFTVHVPSDWTAGNAQINVAHAALVGVSHGCARSLPTMC